MANKMEAEKETGRINQRYFPSDYKHVQAVLDEKAEEMLERTYGPNWKEELNRRTEQLQGERKE